MSQVARSAANRLLRRLLAFLAVCALVPVTVPAFSTVQQMSQQIR